MRNNTETDDIEKSKKWKVFKVQNQIDSEL